MANGWARWTAAIVLVLVLSVGVPGLYLSMPLDDSARGVIAHLWLTALPAAAAAACLRARAPQRGAARHAWLLFAVAGSAGALGQLLWFVLQVGFGRRVAFSSSPFAFFVAFHVLFIAGAVVALRSSDARRFAAEIALDCALIIVAAVVLLPRFLLEPLVDLAHVDRAQFLALGALQLLGLVSLFAAGLLVLRRRSTIPLPTGLALTATAAAFLAGAVLVPIGVDPQPTRPGDAFDILWLTGWAALTVGALSGNRTAVADAVERRWNRIAERIREFIAPATAIFLGAAAIDATLRPAVPLETTLALGALGLLLALRIGHSIRTAEHRADQRRRFVHTQALVELSQALAGETDLQRTLSAVVEWTRRLLDARGAGIELLVEDGRSLEIRAAVGLPSDTLALRFPVEGSFTGWVVRHGQPRASDAGARDPLIQPEARPFIGDSATAAAPLRFRDRPLGALFCLRDWSFDDDELEMLRALADQAAIAIENARLFEQVRALSLTDPLTGLANRRQLERDLAREFAAALRGRSLVAVLFDLDDFKQYNDRYGHLEGDEVLRIFGRLLAAETRAMNLAARYGGDEFVVLLSDGDRYGATVLVDRIRHRFAAALASVDRDPVGVSAGIGGFQSSMKAPDELIAAADRDLYRSKAASTD